MFPVLFVKLIVFSVTDEASITFEVAADEYYERVGRTKPSEFGSKANAADDLPEVTVAMPGAG